MPSGLLVPETSILSDFAGHYTNTHTRTRAHTHTLVSPLYSLLQYLGGGHINNVHPTPLLVFFCSAERL